MPAKKSRKKCFVLDTNVLLHNADSMFSFEENDVVLPIQVIEELDRFKKQPDEIGRNARQVARHLDDLRQIGSLCQGVKTGNGGIVQVLTDFDTELPDTLAPGLADNQILAAANYLMEQGNATGPEVIFVSKDLNARVKADALGLAAEDYETNKINFDELYQGWKIIDSEPPKIEKLREEGFIKIEADFTHNEFAILRTQDDEEYAVYNAEEKTLHRLDYADRCPWGIGALNAQQAFALECLLNERFRLVSLVGKAGTGKTLLALAAGLQKAIDDLAYKRLLVSRPIMPLGRDIGYLPGSKEEKLTHWMNPIFDNLHYIFDNYMTEGLPGEHLEMLLENEKICLEALTYIRGRSIAHQWLVIDEAQNLTPHEIKTIISRAGQGTKVVLTGDPYQIDNPYLDPSSNGLTYLVERFKGQDLFGSVVLLNSERSQLASLATELL